MFLITGVTGTTGSLVRQLLLDRGLPVRGMTRNPSRPDDVHGDFTDPESLRNALRDVTAAYLVTASPTPDHDLAFLAAARAAGVRRVVRLSAIGTGEVFDGSVLAPHHLAADQALAAGGPAWTVLRPAMFATNVLHTPVVNLTGDAKHGVIDPADIAAVAVEALLGGHDGRTYELTGPEALSVPEQAAILGRREVVDVDPADIDPAWRSGVLWARAGHGARLTDDVARVLGRPATRFEQWALGHTLA
ncbi:butenolide phosphate reductase ScbC [Saccharothrix mutabilis subsp. mutabilis]|uniref:Butenolide phosphate reductase ScbC n=1 Tax=Saccharothrix mutabilis subsp. mutabilis TaxID=66855 RepID=A0ABN0UQ75_9PSEU